MSVYTVTLAIQPQQVSHMALSTKTESFDNRENLQLLFTTIADTQNADVIISESPYLRASSQAIISTFFSELFQANQEKLEGFSQEQKANILYQNYRNRLITKMKTQPNYTQKAVQIGAFFLKTDLNVYDALDQYLADRFDAYHFVNPKIALIQVLNLKHLQLNPSELPLSLDDQTQLEIPDEILQRLWGRIH